MPDDNDNYKETAVSGELVWVARSPGLTGKRFGGVLVGGERRKRLICGAYKEHGGIYTPLPENGWGDGRYRFRGARAGRPIKHGAFLKRLAKVVNRAVVEEFLRDPEICELGAEIALLRTQLNDYLNRCEAASTSEPQNGAEVQKEKMTYVRIIEVIAGVAIWRDLVNKEEFTTRREATLLSYKFQYAYFAAAYDVLRGDDKSAVFVQYSRTELSHPGNYKSTVTEIEIAQAPERAAMRLRNNFR